MLRAVFLDFGNTLVDESIFIPAANMGVVDFVRLRAGLSEPRDVLYRKLQATPDGAPADDPRRQEPRTREVLRVDTFLRFAAGCGLALGLADVAGMMAAYDSAAAASGLISGTIEALRRLRTRYRMAIMSNGYAGFVHSTLARHDLRRYFDAVCISQEVNTEKPGRAFYGRGADALGVRPEEVLMVGDRWEADVAGAKRLGMATCWINPERLSPPDPAMCDFTVSRLAELPCLLAERD